MPQRKQAVHRQRRRAQGLRPLEVWLPGPVIERIDAMKSDGEGRDAIIAKLLADTLEMWSPPEATNQLQLAL